SNAPGVNGVIGGPMAQHAAAQAHDGPTLHEHTVGTPDPEKHAPLHTYQGKQLVASDPAIAQKQAQRRLAQYDKDANTKGYHSQTSTKVTPADRFTAIRKQSTESDAFVLMMVGQSLGEQSDDLVLNYNFAGMEGMMFEEPPSDGRAWTRGLVSAIITIA